jgi:hypothetical protein
MLDLVKSLLNRLCNPLRYVAKPTLIEKDLARSNVWKGYGSVIFFVSYKHHNGKYAVSGSYIDTLRIGFER